jgi:hypothetical protein
MSNKEIEIYKELSNLYVKMEERYGLPTKMASFANNRISYCSGKLCLFRKRLG